MKIEIIAEPFDPWQALHNYQTQNDQLSGKYGATSIFIGTMRDFNEGDSVLGMTLEHYPGMTEKCISEAIQTANTRWEILDCLVLHRVGEVLPNQPIVLVAIWASHRGDAFDACRFIMETLKSTAPFWKKEFLPIIENQDTQESPQQNRWVNSNSNGYATKNKS